MKNPVEALVAQQTTGNQDLEIGQSATERKILPDRDQVYKPLEEDDREGRPIGDGRQSPHMRNGSKYLHKPMSLSSVSLSSNSSFSSDSSVSGDDV